MAKKTSISKAAVSRVTRAAAKGNRGQIPKDSFASRLQRTAAKTKK